MLIRLHPSFGTYRQLSDLAQKALIVPFEATKLISIVALLQVLTMTRPSFGNHRQLAGKVVDSEQTAIIELFVF